MKTRFATRIAELEKQLAELKAGAEAETYCELPHLFERKAAINFLKKPNEGDLSNAFAWRLTPQGNDYWAELHNKLMDEVDVVLPPSPKLQIQSWVIQSYIEDFGV